MIDVKLFRIITGEEIVAEIVSQNASEITIKNTLVVLPTQSGTVGFAPWATVIDRDNPEITVSRSNIVYCVELDPGVKKKYNEVYGSGIVTPEDKKLIL